MRFNSNTKLPNTPLARRHAQCVLDTMPMEDTGITISDEQCRFAPLALLRLQSWLSPAFPMGSYSYSHGIEWAVEAGHIHDR